LSWSLLKTRGDSPTLTIQGVQISLAGLVLLLLVALLAGRRIDLQSVPRSGWITLAASLLVNLLMVVEQVFQAFRAAVSTSHL